MSNAHSEDRLDVAPGDEHLEDGSVAQRVVGYLVGLGLAILLTATSFFVAGTDLVWQPSIPVALVVLAIAQMGVHSCSSSTSRQVPTTPITCWRWPSAS